LFKTSNTHTFIIGKGVNIWDEFTHRNVSPIADQSTGDDACKSYDYYKTDVQLLKASGVCVIIKQIKLCVFISIFYEK